jgi:hypothetical protein
MDRQIDAMVYELYGLTDEEITIMEGGWASTASTLMKWAITTWFTLMTPTNTLNLHQRQTPLSGRSDDPTTIHLQ